MEDFFLSWIKLISWIADGTFEALNELSKGNFLHIIFIAFFIFIFIVIWNLFYEKHISLIFEKENRNKLIFKLAILILLFGFIPLIFCIKFNFLAGFQLLFAFFVLFITWRIALNVSEKFGFSTALSKN